MPSIPLHLSPAERDPQTSPNPLPGLLHTPSGLAILEIQGVIHADTAPIAGDSNIPTQTPIGELVFPLYDATAPADNTAWMKRVYLYVGRHQRMTGEVRKLVKPYGVVRRRQGTVDGAEELEVVEVVLFKVVFSSRPEPVGDAEMG
ncbi:hypothetical protein EJ05DRAFT_484252 [Pseudovirgaria hyperparasitica]|uniref:Sister chromatid cohesion protein Ctf8 n=1 Tax=Pseudovirgaria hyperparasitica TaxID=470096 RepID=A0A6A6WCG9_9PEZI|nr:uncharacterized protein EJ05DRAFT_484252 [Pseudovirgaria hyperparasitica]KAF2760532.1 hypothetical protein EJ05DRAFT_484252 [Pseudovirgaria hyperparasitica]